MKNTEITGLTVEELTQKIGSENETLRKLKFAHRVAAIENPMKIKETRKLIARLQTELTAKATKK
jgi:large subunit ribosomal protein L29